MSDMGLLDNIKSKFEEALTSEPPMLSLSMMGPRAVGKTTVIASIFAQSQENISGSNLYVRSASQDSAKLIGYKNMLEHAIEERNPAILPATNTEADFLFDLGFVGKNPTVKLAIKDFPGEFLTDDSPEKRLRVADFMRNANVVVVAIDTPYLVEESGRLNSEKNMPDIVKNYIIKHVAEFQNKLILFVPLKCERYFHEERMHEVANHVIDVYGDLKNFFLENNIASIISPIITLGGMEFDQMVDNSTGMGTITKIATYRIYEEAPAYEPLFCAQPLLYLLTYVSAYYSWLQSQPKGFMDKVKSVFSSYLTADSQFRTEISKMHKRIITDKFGYRILTTNSIFNF